MGERIKSESLEAAEKQTEVKMGEEKCCFQNRACILHSLAFIVSPTLNCKAENKRVYQTCFHNYNTSENGIKIILM